MHIVRNTGKPHLRDRPVQELISPAEPTISTPSPVLPRACRVGPAENTEHKHASTTRTHKQEDTYHMPRPAHRRKGQRARRLRLPRRASSDLPLPPLPAPPLPRAPPRELVNPHPVRDPVALPVKGARVQEHAHAAREEARDVCLGGHAPLVEVRAEARADGRAAGGEVMRGGHAEERARGGVIEQGGDGGVLRVAEGAFAWLSNSWSEMWRRWVHKVKYRPSRCRRDCVLCRGS